MMIAKVSNPSAEFSTTEQDIDLQHRLVNFLHARHVPERESVDIDVSGGVVVVRGPLHSDHAKWLCIECCRRVAGVIRLVDQVVVERPRKNARRNGAPPCTASEFRTAPKLPTASKLRAPAQLVA